MKMSRCHTLLFLIACLIPIAFVLFYLNTSVIRGNSRYINSLLNYIELKKESFNLDFIPNDLKVCEDLFSSNSSSASKSYNMSTNYYLHLKAFNEAVNTTYISTGKKGIEGNTGQAKKQTMILHYLAGHPFVRTVCETGFNMGHSSFNYLTANPYVSVYSFDLGSHAYSHFMSVYMKAQFPGRFSIRFGNSMETIPKFIEENPEVKCDIVLVDGGHTYDVAIADILNFARMANPERNVIMFDDYPTNWAMTLGFGKAWTDATDKGIVKELMRCTLGIINNLERGFVIGKIMRGF